MRKIIWKGFIFILWAGLISCTSTSSKATSSLVISGDLYSVAKQEITFNKVQYELAYSQEFNGNKVPEGFCTASYDGDNNSGRWFDRSRKVVGKQNYPEHSYVANGAYHIIEQHYIDANGLAHQDSGELRTVSLWPEPEQKRIKNPLLDFREGYYEIKFKMPRVRGISFWMGTYAESFSGNLSDGHRNSKGYAWHEVDFCEIHNINGGKELEPLGGFHIADKNDKKVSNGYEFNEATFQKHIAVKENWYDEWHIMQVAWHKNKMEIYYDGKLFRKISVPSYMGEACGKYGLYIVPQYSDYDWEDNPDKNKVDWEDTKKHDYQIDYIRYYVPKR